MSKETLKSADLASTRPVSSRRCRLTSGLRCQQGRSQLLLYDLSNNSFWWSFCCCFYRATLWLLRGVVSKPPPNFVLNFDVGFSRTSTVRWPFSLFEGLWWFPLSSPFWPLVKGCSWRHVVSSQEGGEYTAWCPEIYWLFIGIVVVFIVTSTRLETLANDIGKRKAYISAG